MTITTKPTTEKISYSEKYICIHNLEEKNSIQVTHQPETVHKMNHLKVGINIITDFQKKLFYNRTMDWQNLLYYRTQISCSR